MTDAGEFRSALMEGRVWHSRELPRKHKFEYRIFYGLFDLDEVDALAKKSAVFAVSRFNLFSFYPADYGHVPGSCKSVAELKTSIQKLILDRFKKFVERVELLTMPRVLGYAFNPISVFYCYDDDDVLTHLVYEVNNTFGERIDYAFAVSPRGERIGAHCCEKSLHVSPFFDVSGGYRFQQDFRENTLQLTIDYVSAASEFRPTSSNSAQKNSQRRKSFVASMHLKKKKFSTENLLSLGLRIPLLTLKVTAAIHWQALLLWIKKHRVISKPAPPQTAVIAVEKTSEG
ncbi:MAG: DUF1365 domain-containing protein [Kordiimonadaceae bacterium]|nr:DUF1365 domain-containing protein [Kordiimonadaceae bacterium]MBO6570478.1 DUF1365 domain-containing protein [Kordiimonadaceae bacterium]MBO6966403.1 DUF1365 domain-containing protein [Kordiimonadaceae bacterium]